MAEINKPEGLNVMWAELGEKREPSDAKKRQGWVAEIPTYQDFNWLDGRQDQFIAHLNQRGLPEWDAETEYQAGKSYISGSNGYIYLARTTHTNVDPVMETDMTNWVLWSTGTDIVTIPIADSGVVSDATFQYSVRSGVVYFKTTFTLNGTSDGDGRVQYTVDLPPNWGNYFRTVRTVLDTSPETWPATEVNIYTSSTQFSVITKNGISFSNAQYSATGSFPITFTVL